MQSSTPTHMTSPQRDQDPRTNSDGQDRDQRSTRDKSDDQELPRGNGKPADAFSQDSIQHDLSVDDPI